MFDRTTSIDAFLSATAAKQPTPGGGSVAALAGALSSAIGEMVLSYSIGKKDLLPFSRDAESGSTRVAAGTRGAAAVDGGGIRRRMRS